MSVKMKKPNKNKDSDIQNEGIRSVMIRSVISRTYVLSEEEKKAITIYNYGFWKGFAIASIISLFIGLMIT